MAIKGAFGAGFVSGFGKAFTKTMEDNWERYDKYIDQNLSLARSLAPDFAKSSAEAQQQMELTDTMQSQFGLTDAEVVAIGQNYDMSKVYAEFLKHQQGLPQGVQVRKEDLLSILDIKKGDVLELPDGMTKEDALTAINLGYAKNVATKPGDKSEAHKNRSWAKAVSDVLMLNPKVSAEQAVQQMTTMGIPVEDILLYQAAQASGKQYKPINVGMAAGDLGSLATDYNEESYGKTKRAFATALTKQYFPDSNGDLANITDGTLSTAANLIQVTKDEKPNATQIRKAVGQLVNKGGSAFAKLENDILVSGYYDGFNRKSMREMALMSISDEIDTREELDKFMAAVEDGSLAAAIVSAGGATDEVIQALFGGTINDTNAVAPSFTDMTKQVGRDALDLEATSEKVSYDTSGTPSFRDRRTVAPETPVLDASLKNEGVVGGLLTGDEEPKASTASDPSIDLSTVSALYNPVEDKSMSVEDRINAKREATVQLAGDIVDAAEDVGAKLAAADKTLDVIAGNAVLNIRAKANTTLGALAQIAGNDELANSFYTTAIEAEDGTRKGVDLTQGLYRSQREQINTLLDNYSIPDFSKLQPLKAEDAVNAYVDDPNTEGRDLDADLGVGYEPATTRLYSTMDRLKKLRLAVNEAPETVTPEVILNIVNKPDSGMEDRIRDDARQFAQDRRSFPQPLDRIIIEKDEKEEPVKTETTNLGDLSGAPGFREEPSFADAIMSERSVKREPELLSYEVWKDMSKAERASVGLDLPLVSIQNRVRSGSIPLPRGKSLPTPLRMKQERYLAESTESGTLPRTPKPDALMTKPTKQDLTAPTKESGVAVERSTGTSKALADLRTTFNRIHGKKSKTVKQFEKVLQQAQSGTPIQYTDVNLLLRATRSLPKTKTRDELAKKLYDIAQGLR
jgi:hypothetical protein